MRDWIKLHTEILHDFKFNSLTEIEQLRCIKCFCVAGEMNQGGLLPDLPRLADEISCSIEDTTALMVKLIEYRIIVETEDGYLVKNFEKRQGKITSSKERTRRYRNKITENKTNNNSYKCDRCDAESVTNETNSYFCDRCDGKNVTNVTNSLSDEDNVTESVTNVTNSLSFGKEEKEKKQEKERTKEKELKREKEENINNININNKGFNLINSIAEKNFSACDDGKNNKPSKETKPKLRPTDHEYWRCFGDCAGLAETFYKETGISPVKSEFGRWRKDLNLFKEIGCSEEIMTEAIHRLQQQRLTIGAPGSVFKTARAMLQGKRTTPQPPQDFYSILKGLSNDETGNYGDFGDVGSQLLTLQEPRSSP